MRTPEEVAARIEAVAGDDWLGVERYDLIEALPFAAAKPWLKDDATEVLWPGPVTDETVRRQAVEYLDFAYNKAIDHRAISASRSLSHYRAWLWLLGLLPEDWDEIPYAQYGAPALLRATELLGCPQPTDPDLLRMAEGLPCEPGCEGGCGT